MNFRLDSGHTKVSRLLLAIIAVSVLLRILSAVYQGSTIEPLPGVTDQISYHELAIRVADGHGFSFGTDWWPATRANRPTAHWSFLYVLFLAAIYSVVGPAPLVARLVQALIVGVLHPLLVWRIGSRVFNPTVGLVSAALSSVYVYFAYYGGALITESLYIVAFLWVLDLATLIVWAARAQREPGLGAWLMLGVACALGALLRQVFLLVVPFILLWMVWQFWLSRRRAGRPLGLPMLAMRLAVTLGVVLVCVLPFTVRNYEAFNRFVLLNTNAGFVFYWGNHPLHGTNFVPILPGGSDVNQVNYLTLLPKELSRLNEADLDRALLTRGFGFIADDPARYVLLSISRAKEYFKFWPTSDSGAFSNISRVLSFGLLVPFLVGGFLLALLGPRDEGRVDGAGALLLFVVAAAYSMVHLLTWTLIRYRLPVDAIVMPFAASCLVFLFQKFSVSVPSAVVSLYSSTN